MAASISTGDAIRSGSASHMLPAAGQLTIGGTTAALWLLHVGGGIASDYTAGGPVPSQPERRSGQPLAAGRTRSPLGPDNSRRGRGL